MEKGEEGTPHIQFFMNFVNATRSSVFKKYDKRIHFTRVMRTPEQAEIYCLKEETRVDGPWEYGTKPIRHNCKVDWEMVYANAKKGALEAIPASIIV